MAAVSGTHQPLTLNHAALEPDHGYAIRPGLTAYTARISAGKRFPQEPLVASSWQRLRRAHIRSYSFRRLLPVITDLRSTPAAGMSPARLVLLFRGHHRSWNTIRLQVRLACLTALYRHDPEKTALSDRGVLYVFQHTP